MYNSRIRQEYLDYDYIEKLSAEDKKWLNNFTEEYLGAKFDHEGKKLHRTKKSRRELYTANNARNRCIYGGAKASGNLYDTEGHSIEMPKSNIEDFIKEKHLDGEINSEKSELIQMLINGELTDKEIELLTEYLDDKFGEEYI